MYNTPNYTVGQQVNLDALVQANTLALASTTLCVQADGLYTHIHVAHDGGQGTLDAATVLLVVGVNPGSEPATVLSVFAVSGPGSEYSDFALTYARALHAALQHALDY